MLTFLALAAKKRYVVDCYRDEAVDVLGNDAPGNLAMTRVTLRSGTPATPSSGGSGLLPRQFGQDRGPRGAAVTQMSACALQFDRDLQHDPAWMLQCPSTCIQADSNLPNADVDLPRTGLLRLRQCQDEDAVLELSAGLVRIDGSAQVYRTLE